MINSYKKMEAGSLCIHFSYTGGGMRVGKLHLSLYTFLCACFISVIYHFKVWTINIHLTVLSAKNKKREGINYWNKIISLLHQTQSQLHLSWTELAKPCWNVFPTRILGTLLSMCLVKVALFV